MAKRLSALRRLPFFVRKFLRDLSNPVRYASNTDDVHGARLGSYLVFDEEELKHGIDLQYDAEGTFAHDSLPNDPPGGIFLATQSHLGEARS